MAAVSIMFLCIRMRLVLDGHSAPVSGQPLQRVAAPLARTPILPPNHPHARKNSIMDGQLQLQDLRPPPSMSPFTHTPNASMSTFSLSLDPIAEAGSTSPGAPGTPYIPSPVQNGDMSDIRTQIPPIPSNPTIKRTNGHAYPSASGRDGPNVMTFLYACGLSGTRCVTVSTGQRPRPLL